MKKALALILMVLFLSACSSSSEPNPPVPTTDDHRQAYLEVVRENAPSLSHITDEVLVGIATQACDSLDKGAPAVTVLETLNVLTKENGPVMLGAGISAFCPQHKTLFE